ncbi:deoxyribodipyrimidine photo-lyase [Psychromarinibacter sp. C21-152]|uniref:Deoxyribodipyrimidine photo-lyase n=1 Tax=Psychromarinibacter sediminicola TaxID=3033385 RepID=A0AAE3NUS6_9RHOB|nr:deoxyribodipyrimidine photo-lyase [Psychromarinibacter sediminicola]MDF0602024.1 deoxyribodipyrimidine photo-lyase [Psychromarinibacter sediminicola]
MSDTSPIIVWIRRDLRLSDHAALSEAAGSGRPVIPVFLHDEVVDRLGAAPKWRFGLGVGAFAEALAGIGARLTLRRGTALEGLRALVQETGAGAVWWQRAYDPASQERDRAVKAALKEDGVDARSFAGHLLFEPWTVETKQGDYYKVYTPFWRAVKDREVPAALPSVSELRAPQRWPESDALADWAMGAAMDRGADIVGRYVRVGEAAAQGRLGAFIANGIADYDEARDIPAEDGTSTLSEPLTYGEISPRVCWHAGMRARQDGKPGAEAWLKELVWREFAYHLLHHTPRLETGNWRPEWDAFPWNEDDRRAEVIAWTRGRTGVDFVDAAMREMYVTGRMHNRARMIVASYLTKHLMTHWKIGKAWFEDCLVDWDPASNALGWQWSAGSGPDATPYFRIFNPATQRRRFDPDRRYVRRWVAEGQGQPPRTALDYFAAVPRAWGLSPDDGYPAPVVGLDAGRKRALDAYERRDF